MCVCVLGVGVGEWVEVVVSEREKEGEEEEKEEEDWLNDWLVVCEWGFFLKTLQLLLAYWKGLPKSQYF